MRKRTLWTIAMSLMLTVGLAGFAAADVINGTNGDDELTGTAEADVISAKGGDDWVEAKDGDDRVLGGPGDDSIFGENGDDDLNGGDGADICHGGPGDDLMIGGAGDDQLRGGGGGNDGYIGGDGDDVISLIVNAVFFFPFPPGPPPSCDTHVTDDHDVAHGGDGEDEFQWLSGRVNVGLSFPVFFCYVSDNAEVNGGDGWDVLKIAAGIPRHDGLSTDFALEAATLPGYSAQLRSLTSGATLNFKNIEEIRFRDTTLYGPF